MVKRPVYELFVLPGHSWNIHAIWDGEGKAAGINEPSLLEGWSGRAFPSPILVWTFDPRNFGLQSFALIYQSGWMITQAKGIGQHFFPLQGMHCSRMSRKRVTGSFSLNTWPGQACVLHHSSLISLPFCYMHAQNVIDLHAVVSRTKGVLLKQRCFPMGQENWKYRLTQCWFTHRMCYTYRFFDVLLGIFFYKSEAKLFYEMVFDFIKYYALAMQNCSVLGAQS